MEAAAPLQHIPGEHNGNAILRLVKQEPHMISLKAGDALVGLSVTLPGLLSPPAGNGDGGDSPRHIPAPVRTQLPPPSPPSQCHAGPAGRRKAMPCNPPRGPK